MLPSYQFLSDRWAVAERWRNLFKSKTKRRLIIIKNIALTFFLPIYKNVWWIEATSALRLCLNCHVSIISFVYFRNSESNRSATVHLRHNLESDFKKAGDETIRVTVNGNARLVGDGGTLSTRFFLSHRLLDFSCKSCSGVNVTSPCLDFASFGENVGLCWSHLQPSLFSRTTFKTACRTSDTCCWCFSCFCF